MTSPYDVLKAKWKRRQDTDTLVFGTTRDDAIAKINRLAQTKAAALNGALFTDEEWNITKYPMVALYQNNANATLTPSHPYPFNKVQRLSTVSPQSKFYVDGTTPGDVQQGQVGDCWFLAVLAGAADVPGLVPSVAISINEQAKIYGFVFYNDGWVGTIVDDYLFYYGSYLTFSAAKANEGWVPLLEKAFAKVNGDYESIDGSWGQRALVGIGGINSKNYDLRQVQQNPTLKNELWNAFLAAKNTSKQLDTIFACSRQQHHPANPNGHGEDIKGLVPSHMYTFRRAVNFHGNTLIELRNPWAQTEWNGPWSDSSNQWGPYKSGTTIPELNYSLADDGSFFISYDDFLSEFDGVETCQYPVAVAVALNQPASISTQSLLTAWWYGNYDIYYTDRRSQSNLSNVQLTFGSGNPDGSTILVGGGGTDGIGPYSINNGTYNRISKAITFTKQYNNVNNNIAWLYQGTYNNEVFSGYWGNTANPNQGNFLIRLSDLLERQSNAGSWRGYYFVAADNSSGLMQINLNVQKDQYGNDLITGSGTDVIGPFTIDGQINTNNSVSFNKRYSDHMWNYTGFKKGNAVFGNWGTGVPSGGDFVIWKY